MSKKMRIIIPIVIIAVVCVIFATHAESLQQLLAALEDANLIFIALAVVVLCGRYFMYAWAFHAGFQAINAPISIKKMIEIVMSITFINDTAPTAGMAGSVFMAGWATKKGASTGGAISLVFLDKITFFGSFAIIQTFGLILLAIDGQLSIILVLASLIIYGLAIAFTVALYTAYKSPGTLTKLLALIVKLQHKVSKFLKKEKMDHNWAVNTAVSCQAAAQTIAANPKKIRDMFIRMFCLFLCEFASITFVSISLGFNVVAGIVAAYVAGFIMSMCVVQTVGIIEAVLVVMLMAYGADFGTATAISIVYRGLLFWIPFGIGALCVHRTSQDFIEPSEKSETTKNEENEENKNSINNGLEI